MRTVKMWRLILILITCSPIMVTIITDLHEKSLLHSVQYCLQVPQILVHYGTQFMLKPIISRISNIKKKFARILCLCFLFRPFNEGIRGALNHIKQIVASFTANIHVDKYVKNIANLMRCRLLKINIVKNRSPIKCGKSVFSRCVFE